VMLSQKYRLLYSSSTSLELVVVCMSTAIWSACSLFSFLESSNLSKNMLRLASIFSRENWQSLTSRMYAACAAKPQDCTKVSSVGFPGSTVGWQDRSCVRVSMRKVLRLFASSAYSTISSKHAFRASSSFAC